MAQNGEGASEGKGRDQPIQKARKIQTGSTVPGRDKRLFSSAFSVTSEPNSDEQTRQQLRMETRPNWIPQKPWEAKDVLFVVRVSDLSFLVAQDMSVSSLKILSLSALSFTTPPWPFSRARSWLSHALVISLVHIIFAILMS